eukprot:CAMPEP_0197426132 /NCGR_PEP_ID=MMETSP1170-20131217/33806_1 /TAXON_ID=54406 /ORGANISM="Sarcinochrysis sp, Strain CCMP770" /LENGTH=214 /DNA_ID=CAMNT_0042953753 /DNA_START=70 /DNA_END=714 /DNA_ORIENTATION=+
MTLIVSGVALSLVTRRVVVARAASSEALRLAELWKGGIETMLSVPPAMTDLVLKPCGTDAESRGSFGAAGPPFALAFALTAFDPPGVARSREANADENGKLWRDIVDDARPERAWRGFGCDFQENWREDGFILQFDPKHRDRARRVVLDLAKKYHQGAIYEYLAVDGALHRRTVGAALDAIDEVTPMASLDPTSFHHLDLARLPWAGPDDAGVL